MAVERDMGAGGMPGILPLDENPEAIVEIEEMQIGPGILEMEDGSAIVGEFEEETVTIDLPFDGNLADTMDSGELGTIASDLIGSIDDDLSSRKDWEDTYKKGIEFLGMKNEKRSEPFEGSSGIVHPLLAESVTQFQSQAYRELLPAQGPVRVQVFGEETEALIKQAERVQEYMNYMITCKMEEYDPELDQMLFYLPIIGSTFKKIYFNPLKNRAVSDFVHAEDLIVPYGVSDLASSPRVTHRISMNSNEVRKLQLAGFYSDDIDLPSSGTDDSGEVQESINDIQGVHPTNNSEELTLYEVHLNLDLEGFEDIDEMGEPTGLQLPYIVTILEDTSEVLSIRRNYEEQDTMKKQKHFFVHYKFLPGLGFYGLGLTHMIGGLAQASTSILRQLIDAGTLANLPAGFKARGARIKNDDEPLQPGEFRDIDVVSGDLRGALMPLPFKEPSGTLYNLLGNLVDAGRRFASMADLKVGEMGGDTPVGTTMAIMERGTKVMSAIHKRLHYSQKLEFKLLAQVFSKSVEPYPYIISNEVGPEVKAQDFDGRVDVIPTSDPNIFSMSQRIALAQTQLQLVQSNPEIHGGPQGLYQAYRKMYEALGVSNIDALLPAPPQPQPVNAAKENQNSLLGVPLQAFPGQDHQAHIETHLAIMSTPAVEMNPNAIMALQGHVQEHIGLMSEEQAQQQIMQGIPPEVQQDQQQMQAMMQQIQPQIDKIAAQIIADTVEQLSQSMETPPETDPLVEIRNKELEIKAADLQRKDSEFVARQEFDREKEINDNMIDQQRVAVSQEALRDKTRIAEDRIQTQRDIASLNARQKAN